MSLGNPGKQVVVDTFEAAQNGAPDVEKQLVGRHKKRKKKSSPSPSSSSSSPSGESSAAIPLAPLMVSYKGEDIERAMLLGDAPASSKSLRKEERTLPFLPMMVLLELLTKHFGLHTTI